MASEGDIRVLLVMDLILSVMFSYVIIWGLSFIGVLTFSWWTVALATVIIALLTYLAVLR